MSGKIIEQAETFSNKFRWNSEVVALACGQRIIQMKGRMPVRQKLNPANCPFQN